MKSDTPTTSLWTVGGLGRADGPAARDFLVRSGGPMVYVWCRHFRMAPTEAASILREVLVEARQHIRRTLKPIPSDDFQRWLWAATRRRLFQSQAAAASGGLSDDRPGTEQELPDEPPFDLREPHPTQDHVEATPTYFDILSTLRTEFDEPMWQAFWRWAMKDEDTQAISKELGMTVGSVLAARCQVLRRFRERLQDR